MKNRRPMTAPDQHLDWDARGRLVKLTNGNVIADYLVGANGVRVAKTVTR